MKLITDRSQANSTRLAQLAGKSWEQMTAAERAEWSGDPLLATDVVNFVPPIGENVNSRDGSIYCDSTGFVTIGNTEDWVGRQVTLSCACVSGGGSMTLRIQATSSAYSDVATLSEAGSLVMTIPSSLQTGTLRLVFSPGYYGKVMLELGRNAHDYVPYTEIVPTDATKGAYNYSDLNRVERAVAEIAEILAVSVVTKTDWSGWDIPTKTDLARYLSNVRLLQEICGETTELPETLDKMTYSTANKIEEALLRCRNIAERTYRCGELICGEVI